MNRLCVIAGLTSLVLIGSGATAEAQRGSKIFGTWRSTSGNTFVVSGGGHFGFSLTFIQPSGTSALLRGRWVPGLRGTQFNYWDQSGNSYTGTFTDGDPNRIRILAGDGAVTWWQRAYAAPQPYAAAPPPQPYGAAPQPQPYPAHHGHHRGRVIPCWWASDPGCGRTRNGFAPMSAAAFTSFLALVRSAKPHVFPMKDRVQAGIAGQYLTSAQLVRVVEEFKPHVYPMLDVVKICAPRLVDPENGVGQISQTFSPHTMVGTEAATVVAAQRGDP